MTGEAPQQPERAATEPTGERRSAIRTLQGDIADTVHAHNLSVADIAIAQQQRSREAADAAVTMEAPRDRSNVWWIIGALAFIFLGVGVGTAVVYLLPDTGDVVVEAPESALITSDARQELDVTDMTFEGFTNAIGALAPNAGNPGTITVVALSERGRDGISTPLSTERLFDIIHSRAPARLIRSLDDVFAFGVATMDVPSVFLVFKTNSYENAFAGMLEWERLMADDLPFIAATLPLPPVVIEPIATSTSAATSTATSAPETAPLPPVISNEVFEDIIIDNKDVRRLSFTDGSPRILYAFPDEETLVITLDEKALSLLFERLSAARFTR